MARSTTTQPKLARAERFRLNLDHRPSDKSHAYRRRMNGGRDVAWDRYFGKRSMRLRHGFDDEWDSTDHELDIRVAFMLEDLVAARRLAERRAVTKGAFARPDKAGNTRSQFTVDDLRGKRRLNRGVGLKQFA